MITESSAFVGTGLGRLHIRRAGEGPPVLLWHSLFVDSSSWGTIFGSLAQHYRVTAVDGPCHGRSAPLTRNFTFDEVVEAAATVLDRVDPDLPVHWVGNAWGGHIGIHMASRHPDRLQTLTTIGTPVRGLTARERWTLCWPLVQLYRLTGPRPWLVDMLADTLIGAEVIAAQPDRSGAVMASFAAAERRAMTAAMCSMMLRRPGMAAEAAQLDLPVLMLAARDDGMGASPGDARAVAATMTDARVVEVRGTGHVAPLLADADALYQQLVAFWRTAR